MIEIPYKRLILGILLPVICAFTLSCNQANATNQREITIEEAAALLDQAVQYASDRDIDGLCGMSRSVTMCRHFWQHVNEWEKVPAQYPEIIDTYLRPQKDFANGTYQVGGRMLVVKGIDGLGNPYQSDIFIFIDSGTGEPAVMYPIYWGNVSIGETDDQGRSIVHK